MIDTLVIPTANRPDALRLCLESHLAHARLRRRRLEIVVLDDSDHAATVANAEVIRSASYRHACRVDHVDDTRRERWIDELVSAGAPAFTTRAALRRGTGYSIGAARNVGLLATVGRVVVSSDDLVRCEVEGETDLEELAGAAVRGEALPVDHDGNPGEVWFYERPEEIPRGDERSDLFASYALSLSLPAHATRGRPVIAAMGGTRGADSSPMYGARLFTRGSSRERLFVRCSAWRTGLARRRARRFTLVDSPSGTSAHVALDNRVELPPFAPADVNEDGVFFALVRRLHPDSVIGVVPASVWLEPRAVAPTLAERYGLPLRINDFVVQAILGANVVPRSAGAARDGAWRYTSLAIALSELAMHHAFEELVSSWWQVRCRYWIGIAELALTQRDVPLPWMIDVRRFRDEVARSQSFELPVEAVRARIASIAAILHGWPAMRTAAAKLIVRKACAA